VPGVRAVGSSHIALLSGAANTDSMFIEGRDAASRSDAYKLVVSPGFFDALRVPTVAGRVFDAGDNQQAPKVAVINRTAAREFFPGQDPIGQRFGGSVEQNTDIEIVGIVGDVKYDSLRDAAPPTFFVPALQSPAPRAFFAVRAAVDPLSLVSALREAVRQIDPNLPMTDITTQAAEVDGRLLQERLFAKACSLFGGLATLVAAIGLFGLMSYTVARRTNEIGIRMTLGAEPSSVLGLVLRESMALVAIGIALGLVAAMAAARLVASQLYGLAPTDPATAIGAAALMIAAAAVAAYIPARRASKVDPMVALRAE
jgi:predicted permease